MQNSLVKFSLFLFAASAVWFGPRQSYAQATAHASSSEQIAARVLFDRGKERLVAGKFDEACGLLEESNRLVPGIGVLMHLAVCLEKLNQFAAAWAAFHEAADRAHAEGDVEREKVARQRANQLDGELAFLTLRLHAGGHEIGLSDLPEGLKLLRDGKPVPSAMVGLESPIDPGRHEFAISAPGTTRVTRSVTLTAGQHFSLEVELLPQLQSQTQTPPSQQSHQPILPPALSAPPTQRQPTGSVSHHSNWVAWSAAGIGVASIAVGMTSGLLASRSMNSAREYCANHASNDCPAVSLHQQDKAQTFATASTVTTAAGLGLLVFAGGYWLLAGEEHASIGGQVTLRTATMFVKSSW